MKEEEEEQGAEHCHCGAEMVTCFKNEETGVRRREWGESGMR